MTTIRLFRRARRGQTPTSDGLTSPIAINLDQVVTVEYLDQEQREARDPLSTVRMTGGEVVTVYAEPAHFCEEPAPKWPAGKEEKGKEEKEAEA